ncbi:MAG TPA: cell division protein ZapA [Alphaproteobacteria bacterium]|nr:cell division protein ZapA [Alphaproteobacteria bacterium]
MSQVTVTVNSRSYAITCEDGQERHVQGLAAELDRRVGTTARDLGQVGEARLLLLTALMILDELVDADVRADDPAARESLRRLDRLEEEAARAIDGLAQRVEAVAARLEAP